MMSQKKPNMDDIRRSDVGAFVSEAVGLCDTIRHKLSDLNRAPDNEQLKKDFAENYDFDKIMKAKHPELTKDQLGRLYGYGMFVTR